MYWPPDNLICDQGKPLLLEAGLFAVCLPARGARGLHDAAHELRMYPESGNFAVSMPDLAHAEF